MRIAAATAVFVILTSTSIATPLASTTLRDQSVRIRDDTFSITHRDVVDALKASEFAPYVSLYLTRTYWLTDNVLYSGHLEKRAGSTGPRRSTRIKAQEEEAQEKAQEEKAREEKAREEKAQEEKAQEEKASTAKGATRKKAAKKAKPKEPEVPSSQASLPPLPPIRTSSFPRVHTSGRRGSGYDTTGITRPQRPASEGAR